MGAMFFHVDLYTTVLNDNCIIIPTLDTYIYLLVHYAKPWPHSDITPVALVVVNHFLIYSDTIPLNLATLLKAMLCF